MKNLLLVILLGSVSCKHQFFEIKRKNNQSYDSYTGTTETTNNVSQNPPVINDFFSEESFPKIQKSIGSLLKRALDSNLEIQNQKYLMALQKIQFDALFYDLLPQVVASYNSSIRSNLPWSTNSQGSQTDEYSSQASIQIQWSVYDFSTAYLSRKQCATQSLYQVEIKDRIANQIIRNTLFLFHQVKAGEEIYPKTKELILSCKEEIGGIEDLLKYELMDALPLLNLLKNYQTLLEKCHDLKTGLERDKLQLASLLQVPPERLLLPKDRAKHLPCLPSNPQNLVNRALRQRRELREFNYESILLELDHQIKKLPLYPNLELSFSRNSSDNEDLLNRDWGEFTASISYNLLSLFSKNLGQKEFSNQKSQLKVGRLITCLNIIEQVYLSIHDLWVNLRKKPILENKLSIQKRIYQYHQGSTKNPMLNRFSVKSSKFEYMLASLEYKYLIANLYRSGQSLLLAIGEDLLPNEPITAKELEKKVVAEHQIWESFQ